MLNMANNFIKILKIILTSAFAVACGLLLVRFSIPVYFKLFSPISKTLYNFYIVAGVFAFLIVLLDIIFFKMEKYNWGVLISGITVLLFVFGIPIFMLENNNMLWREAVINKSGPVYFIEFSDQNLSALRHFQNLFKLTWDAAYLYVYVVIVVYLVGYFSLRKLGWRIGGVKI